VSLIHFLSIQWSQEVCVGLEEKAVTGLGGGIGCMSTCTAFAWLLGARFDLQVIFGDVLDS
jgi:hypothetical protein